MMRVSSHAVVLLFALLLPGAVNAQGKPGAKDDTRPTAFDAFCEALGRALKEAPAGEARFRAYVGVVEQFTRGQASQYRYSCGLAKALSYAAGVDPEVKADIFDQAAQEALAKFDWRCPAYREYMRPYVARHWDRPALAAACAAKRQDACAKLSEHDQAVARHDAATRARMQPRACPTATRAEELGCLQSRSTSAFGSDPRQRLAPAMRLCGLDAAECARLIQLRLRLGQPKEAAAIHRRVCVVPRKEGSNQCRWLSYWLGLGPYPDKHDCRP
jgi:hypothetical protein